MSVVTRWRARLAVRKRLLAAARRRHVAKPSVTTRGLLNKRKGQVAYALRVLARRVRPLRVRALKEALALVGALEQGGNNTGPVVDQIIRANGGSIGEPWCGDFVAFCYRRAGSKSVNRSWASVRLLAALTYVHTPSAGHVVRYEFDHTGLFFKWVDRKAGYFLAVEGNTGASGAVSDSANGNDGVRIKRRHISQVEDFRRVLR